jgi:hypothetical protein
MDERKEKYTKIKEKRDEEKKQINLPCKYCLSITVTAYQWKST